MSADPEFENLVKLYYRDLYRFGFSLTGSEFDATDLTQETFYIWANKRHQLRNPANVKGWLFTTLHREFLKICRHRKRTLLNFLGQIDECYRAPLVLYYLEDLSYKQIGNVLAIPLGTVQSRIARAKIKLFQLLSETKSRTAV